MHTDLERLFESFNSTILQNDIFWFEVLILKIKDKEDFRFLVSDDSRLNGFWIIREYGRPTKFNFAEAVEFLYGVGNTRLVEELMFNYHLFAEVGL